MLSQSLNFLMVGRCFLFGLYKRPLLILTNYDLGWSKTLMMFPLLLQQLSFCGSTCYFTFKGRKAFFLCDTCFADVVFEEFTFDIAFVLYAAMLACWYDLSAEHHCYWWYFILWFLY